MTIPASILLLSVTTAAPCARDNASRFHTLRPVHAAQSVVAPHAADRVAIAVFSNISATAADDWIGVGIAETLAAALDGAGGVSVVGRQAVTGALASLRTDGGNVGATAEQEVIAGRLLGARWVIDGGYQRLRERIRITARVVEVATGRVVHTAIVDGAVAELFVLQDRLAAELRREVTDGGRAAVAAPGGARAHAPASLPTRRARPRLEASRSPGGAGVPLRRRPPGSSTAPPPPVAPETLTRDATGRATVRAVRLTEPLRLDGTLDEGVYETVPPVDGFIQQVPDEGAASTEETEAWVFFDTEGPLCISTPVGLGAPPADRQRDAARFVPDRQ